MCVSARAQMCVHARVCVCARARVCVRAASVCVCVFAYARARLGLKRAGGSARGVFVLNPIAG